MSRNIPKFTTVVGVDYMHIQEFRYVWPTWVKWHSEFLENPLLVVADGVQSAEWWKRQLSTFVHHGDVTVVTHDAPGATQRAKMLSGLVYVPAEHLKTDWFLKIDTDVVAGRGSKEKPWPLPEWFSGEPAPVFTAPGWSYTKPAALFLQLAHWASTKPELRSLPEAPAQIFKPEGKCYHKRIISWLMFGQTSFLRRCAELAKDTYPLLPSPSQDTFLWYCAERLQLPYLRHNMKQYNFGHSNRRLAKRCLEALEGKQGDESSDDS